MPIFINTDEREGSTFQLTKESIILLFAINNVKMFRCKRFDAPISKLIVKGWALILDAYNTFSYTV
ncbi:MAG: hypothetical protein DRH17_04970 [Deltaproteobacteria bacterium]|nr:MAG: hypothetical protein DRH17_04970 [Deltaproteobacteria bacterium]